MAIRFRKSIKLAPGVKINLSKSGVSTSLGGRGASVNVGKRGVYGTIGAPGTGLSSRTKLGGTSQKMRYAAPGVDQKMMNEDDNAEYVRALAEKSNRATEAIINIAHITPKHDDDLCRYYKKEFPTPQPIFKMAKRNWLYALIVFAVSANVLPRMFESSSLVTLFIAITFLFWKRNLFDQKKFSRTILKEWTDKKTEFDSEQAQKETEFEALISSNDYDSILEYALDAIDWPRETDMTYELSGDTAKIDIDLPEIEDMPDEIYECKGRGKRKNLETKNKSEAQLLKDYARHVHGIGMVVCGTVFCTLEHIDNICISAYTQRVSPATGEELDDYLYSVKIPRTKWEKINLDAIDRLDPVAVLGKFEIRREMTKSGVFTPIEPY